MDTGNGRMEMFDVPDVVKNNAQEWERKFKNWEDKLHVEYPNHGGTFYEGEEIEIKGSRFRIAKIIQNGLKLELLPR